MVDTGVLLSSKQNFFPFLFLKSGQNGISLHHQRPLYQHSIRRQQPQLLLNAHSIPRNRSIVECAGKNLIVLCFGIYIGNMLEELLQGNGYAVLRAYSGTEALYLLSQNKPDLVLLDLMLPGLSGEEVLPHIENANQELKGY